MYFEPACLNWWYVSKVFNLTHRKRDKITRSEDLDNRRVCNTPMAFLYWEMSIQRGGAGIQTKKVFGKGAKKE